MKDRLARFESGQLEAWWHLNCELTLSPESRHYGADQDFLITKMPGWLAADEEIRIRIIAAAAQYLQYVEPLVSEWLGKGSFKRSDYAAYRALILLREARREIYAGLGAWKKPSCMIPFAAEACSAAPAEFAETVQKLIRAERAKTPKDPEKAQQLTPFLSASDWKMLGQLRD